MTYFYTAKYDNVDIASAEALLANYLFIIVELQSKEYGHDV